MTPFQTDLLLYGDCLCRNPRSFRLVPRKKTSLPRADLVPNSRTSVSPTAIERNFNTMKVLYFSNELPNDDLQLLLKRLYLRSKSHRHPLLARFFEQATSAVRAEVRQLSSEQKKLFPSFESIIDLAGDLELRKSILRSSVGGVLPCFFQIATYIG